MNLQNQLLAYLGLEKNKVNSEFQQYEETTAGLFQMVYTFLDVDFEELTDNRIYRFFLESFKEIICFAFERGVPKSYLRCFFKCMNDEIVVGYLCRCAKSREQDIRNVMKQLLHFFITSWQGCNNNRAKVLGEIVWLIDHWM